MVIPRLTPDRILLSGAGPEGPAPTNDLRVLKNLPEAVVEAAGDAISIADENGLNLVINWPYTRIARLSREDVLYGSVSMGSLVEYDGPGYIQELEKVLGRAIFNLSPQERILETKHFRYLASKSPLGAPPVREPGRG